MKKITILFLLLIFILSGCNQTNSESSAELTELFVSLLQNQQSFYSINRKTDCFLSDYNKSIWKYSTVDMDSDKDPELAIMFEDGNILILRKDSASIFGYDFGIHSMYQINDDGSFLWNGDTGNVYGCSVVEFSGDQYKTVELWRVENDESDSTAYYVNEKPVSKEEFETVSLESDAKSINWALWTEFQWENTETCSYIINSSLPEYSIKITYESEEKQIATSLSLFKENDGNEIQHIDLSDNYRFTKSPIYVTDITFDGYADVVIPRERPASAQYFTAFVWDVDTNQLIYAPTFELLPNVALDTDEKVILSNRSGDKTTTYLISSFDNNLNDFKVCKSLCYYLDGEKIVYEEQKLENGTMQKISEFTVPYSENDDCYAMDPELKNYYTDKSDWDFDSYKWNEYLIPLSEQAFDY